MSSRSKEKVAAVLKKIFKGSDKVGDATANDNKKITDATTTTAASTNGPTMGAAKEKNNNNNNNKEVATVAAGDASSIMESPGKRMRREDYKISSSTRGNTNGAQFECWFRPPDTNIRARRLMKELTEMQRVQKTRKNPEFTIELVNDNLYEWHARLHVIDPDSKLAKDMVELNIPHILLHLIFPDNFPFAPPFMRVVEPHIEKGFVMEGGAICMELLTPRGWASAYTVEAVLMQFSASLVKGQGRVVRKQKGNKDYTRRVAEESFRSLVKTHEKYGWVTPSLSDG